MSTSPLDFLKSAEAFAQSENEVSLRSAISRSYYAVFHTALDVAETSQLPDTSAYKLGTHAKLALRFELGSKNGKSIAYILQSLHRERVRADYHLKDSVSNIDVQTHLGTVKKLLERLQQYST